MKEVSTEDVANIIISNKDEFNRWLERGVWHCKKLNQLSNRNNEWIPVSEGLPKETGCYQCTVEWFGASNKEVLIKNGIDIERRVMEVYYFENTKEFKEVEECCTYKVLAWKTLPEPYIK